MKEVFEIIMTIKDIAILIAGVVLAALYITLVIIAVVKKKKKGEPVDIQQTMAEIAQKVLPLVRTAEIAFKSVSDKKMGALKLKDVLNDVKDMCAEGGVPYNKSYWTDYIKSAVDLINIDRDSTKESKSTETPTDASKTTI